MAFTTPDRGSRRREHGILVDMIDPATRDYEGEGPAVHHGPPHPCPYLPGRTAENEYLVLPRLPPDAYQSLMDRGFRRSGVVVYRPVCTGCRECVPIRIAVADFKISRSQRRILRRNTDVTVRVDQPSFSEEKHRLFVAYLRTQHDGSMSEARADFEEFLYHSPTTTLEMTYLLEGRLVAVGIVDLCPTALSSVYFFFDPAFHRRSLGIFGGLCEIEECRRRGLSWWYLGYYVRDCGRMNYKACFRPHELLDPGGNWNRIDPTLHAVCPPRPR